MQGGEFWRFINETCEHGGRLKSTRQLRLRHVEYCLQDAGAEEAAAERGGLLGVTVNFRTETMQELSEEAHITIPLFAHTSSDV